MSSSPSIAFERRILRARLDEARARTDEIFRLVAPHALYDRPIPERHRLIFYRGHVEAFDWNLLAPVQGLDALDPRLDRLFAFGIDPVGGGLPNEPASDWPERRVVEDYAREVRERLDQALDRDPDIEDSRLLDVAIEHRLMHAETLSYLLHQLPYDRKIAPADALVNARETGAGALRSIAIPAGIATLGRRREAPGFGWDNEFDEVRAEVPAFTIDSIPVTNGRYLEFVQAGGYEDPRYWADEDWVWRSGRGMKHPHFWEPGDTGFSVRGMFALRPFLPDHPVYVSLAEARAFARWARGVLPTEAQFHRAAYGEPGDIREREYPWGDQAPAAQHGNFDFRHWDTTAVDSHPAGNSAFGVADLIGNGWEWTSTPFRPLPGFEPFPFYRGYSADFYDDHHFVMKGGSSRTAAVMLRRSFRNWFQPHYPHVYAKFRLVHREVQP